MNGTFSSGIFVTLKTESNQREIQCTITECPNKWPRVLMNYGKLDIKCS